jgi:hypothetical protein
LHRLSIFLTGKELKVIDISKACKSKREVSSAAALKKLFDYYGSDKANNHNYHLLYGSILCNPANISKIFEVGLGSGNPNIVSNMGKNGRPGASLRAFRDYCKDAKIYGADIDREVLFREERIQTYWLDQTNPGTFKKLYPKLKDEFDLVIDDGLHSPNANVITLEFGLKIIKKGGWVVIEDIRNDAIPLWQVVASLLPSQKYTPYILKARGAIIFAVKRLK